ncbi:MAG: DNA translocase FtsK 4TM domain-containing protein [Vicinamibacterales bacterium]
MRITSAACLTSCRTCTVRSYGTPFTLALVEPKLREHGLEDRELRPIRPRERATIGPFEIEFIRVTHSMPDCVALAIHTPLGTVVHTGDFKIDQTPIDGEHFDLHRFGELGSEGVLALLADSTNVDRRGFTGSETDVIDAFEEIFTSADGKLIVSAFSSSIYRMQIVVDLAAQFDRKVAFIGRGMVENSAIAQRLGYLRVPAGLQIRDSEVMNYPAQDVLCLTTGSQGEPMSALSRIAVDDHRHVKIAEDDTVVISARAIPGNEKSIGRVMNHLARRGTTIIHEGVKHVHVSGHGSEEELKLVLSLVKPRYFIPVHGEFRQLSHHARVARRVFAGQSPQPEDPAGGERRHRGHRSRGGACRRKSACRSCPDRRHAHGRDRRRSAPRSAASGRGRSGGAGRRHQQAERDARRGPGDHHARVRDGEQPGTAGGRRPGACRCLRTGERRGAHRPGDHQGEAAGGAPALLPQAFGPAPLRAAGHHGDLTPVKGSTISRRLSEFVGVALFAAALFWIVSLASYEPKDPAWFFKVGETGATANFAGQVGAFLAELNFQLVGYTAFAIPALLIILGWNYFWCRAVDAPATKTFGGALLFGCLSTILSMGFSRTGSAGMASNTGGGYLGQWLSTEMASYFGIDRIDHHPAGAALHLGHRVDAVLVRPRLQRDIRGGDERRRQGDHLRPRMA